jgi:hypothetical protein
MTHKLASWIDQFGTFCRDWRESCGYLGGDVDAGGAPGDAAAATDTAGRTGRAAGADRRGGADYHAGFNPSD